MQELILLKNGEIALKGLNRGSFEDILIKNCKRRLEPLGEFHYSKAQSTIYITPVTPEVDLQKALEALSTVFGIAGLCRACLVEKDLDAICAAAESYLAPALLAARTFKVEAKRSDKRFPLNSPQLCRELGGHLLQHFPHLTVDVHNPEVTVYIEIRDFGAYLHTTQLPGAGGIPVGSGGRALLLASGGIDSPVAGYRMAKRGLELMAVHFASPPYTSERARHKVETLCAKLAVYCGRVTLFIVPFTEIQEQIRREIPEEYFTLVMRRFMMRIADAIARKENCGCLVTGESLGQVASQTMPALACTEAVVNLPVLRPLIGMDKEEIVRTARQIDTFETSILPYEDCCTVFTPRHPKTNPRLPEVERLEAAMPIDALVEAAAKTAELVVCRADQTIKATSLASCPA